MTLNSELKRWEEATRKSILKRHPERKDQFKTPSGIPIPPILIPSDASADYLESLGFPGEYPFTRGVQPTMYRGRYWTMRQYAGYATAEESNIRYRYLLDQGQTGLSIAFDLPTQIVYDSDDPIASGEVGKVGRHVDITQSPEALDPERLRNYALVFVAFEFYRTHEAFFRLLPESLRSRITVLARPADFPSVDEEIKCSCFCSGLKALLPRQEAPILDHHHSPNENRQPGE